MESIDGGGGDIIDESSRTVRYLKYPTNSNFKHKSANVSAIHHYNGLSKEVTNKIYHDSLQQDHLNYLRNQFDQKLEY